MRLILPAAFYEGRRAAIAWSPHSDGGPYKLERRLDKVFADAGAAASWTERDALERGCAQWDALALRWAELDALRLEYTIYEGMEGAYMDFIPKNAGSVQYRVSASGEVETGPTAVVVHDEPPIISGSDGEIGPFYKGFSLPFTVTNPFPEAVLETTVEMDASVLERRTGMSSPAAGEVLVDDARIGAMEPGSSHTLTITARDDLGKVSARVYSFVKTEDLRESSTFYLLRDGIAVQKRQGIAPFSDYTAVGRHRYRVRAVDRFGGMSDSNEIELQTVLRAPVIAPADAPERMMELASRVGEPPACESTLEPDIQLYQFEGRPYSAAEEGGGYRADLTLRFCAEDRVMYDTLAEYACTGRTMLYRDPDGNCAYGIIQSLPCRYCEGGTNFEIRLIRLDDARAVDYD